MRTNLMLSKLYNREILCRDSCDLFFGSVLKPDRKAKPYVHYKKNVWSGFDPCICVADNNQ
jgi:hypothetical protein